MDRDHAVRTIRMYFGGAYAALGLFALATYRGISASAQPAAEWQFAPEPLTIAACAFAAAGVAASLWLPRWLLAMGAQARKQGTVPLEPLDASGKASLAALTPLVALCLALAEAPAIAGMVLAHAHHTMSPLWPFLAVSAVAFAVHWPTLDRLDAMARSLRGDL